MRKLGTADIDVFPLCLGTNVFGWTIDEEESFEVLDAYLAAGGNFVDSADSYSSWVDGNQGGESETILGNWMASRGNRDKVVIGTKLGQLEGREGLSAENIAKAAEDSLARLQTDYIDVYYAHADDPSTPVEETLAAFDALIRAGKVRTIGASNFEAQRLSQALALADEKGLPRFIAIQPHYNLIEREYEDELRQVGDREKLACVPYFSLASGFLTGKFRPGGTAETRRGLHSGETHLGNADSLAALEVLLAVADELAAPPAAVALAWLGEQPTVTAPIASARSVDQLEDLLAMVDVSLNDDQRLRLDVNGGQGK